jgi:Tol biopolymer transport system component
LRALIVSIVLIVTLAAVPSALAGGRIAFTSVASGNEDIWLVDQAGGNLTDLTPYSPGSDQAPAWAPDGTQLAFISDRTGARRLWLVNSDGSKARQLLEGGESGFSDASPAWSPDGTQIAFSSTRLTGSWAVWLVGADGSGLRRVSPGFGVSPSWSPDGSRLVYDSSGAIHVMNADGSDDHAITSGDVPDDAPAWSPDGSRIAFGRYSPDWQTSNVREIWSARPDGTDAVQLTAFGGYADHPSWSPDGSRLVFQVRRATDPPTASGLATMTPDGRNLSGIPTAPFGSFQPAWGRSGPIVHLYTPTDGGFYNQNWIVTAHYSCDETAVTCVGTVPQQTPLDTSRTGQFTFTVAATDASGYRTTVAATYTVVDKTPPSVSFQVPCCDNPVFQLGATIATSFSCDDGPNGSGVELCAGDPYLDTSTVEQHTFYVQTRDGAGNSGYAWQSYRVWWPFSFAPPVAPPPTYNEFRSSEPVPVKFLLGGDRGLDVIESVYYNTVNCDTGATIATGGVRGTLSYNASLARYTYQWQTDSSLAATCAQLFLALRDGSRHEAWFRFKR